MRIQYQLADSAFLQQFNEAQNKLEAYRDENGGDQMPPDAKRLYDYRKRHLQVLANFYDESKLHQDTLLTLLQEAEDKMSRMAQQMQDYRRMLGDYNPVLEKFIPHREYLQIMVLGKNVPKPLAAFLDRNEADRFASRQRAIQKWPECFAPDPTSTHATAHH